MSCKRMQEANGAFEILLNCLRTSRQQARTVLAQTQDTDDTNGAAVAGRRVVQLTHHIHELEHLQRRWEGLVETPPNIATEAVTPQEDFFVPILQALVRFGEPAKAPWVLEFLERVMEEQLTLEDWEIIATRPLVLWHDTAKCAAQQLIEWGLIYEPQPGKWQLSPQGAAQLTAYRQTRKPIGQSMQAEEHVCLPESQPPEQGAALLATITLQDESGLDEQKSTDSAERFSEEQIAEFHQVEACLKEHLVSKVRSYGRTPDQDFIIPLLQAVDELKEGARIGKVIDRVGELMHNRFTRADWEHARSGYRHQWQRNAYRIHQALRKCRLIRYSKQGSVPPLLLTDLGRSYLEYRRSKCP